MSGPVYHLRSCRHLFKRYKLLPFSSRQDKEPRSGVVTSCHKLCDKRDVEFIRVEDQGPLGWFWVPVGLVQQLKEPSSDVHWDSHDDALGHTWNQAESRAHYTGLQTGDLRTSSTTHHLTELGSPLSFPHAYAKEHCLWNPSACLSLLTLTGAKKWEVDSLWGTAYAGGILQMLRRCVCYLPSLAPCQKKR